MYVFRRRLVVWHHTTVELDVRGHRVDVSLAAIVLVELGTAAAPRVRHAAVACGAGWTHAATAGRCRVHVTQEQGNREGHRGHTADNWTTHSASCTQHHQNTAVIGTRLLPVVLTPLYNSVAYQRKGPGPFLSR